MLSPSRQVKMRLVGVIMILILVISGCSSGKSARSEESQEANTVLTMYERLSLTRGVSCFQGHCMVRGVIPLYVVDGTPLRVDGENYVLNHLSVYEVESIRVLSIDETIRYPNHEGSVVEILTKR